MKKKKRKTNHNFIQAGSRNFAIGRLARARNSLTASARQLKPYLNLRQAEDLLRAQDLVRGVYDSLARKYFN